MAWRLDQTMNSQTGTGRLVIKDSVIEIDLEAAEECNIPFAASISFREKVNERVRAVLNRRPGTEMEEIEKHSLLWGLFLTSSMHAPIFLGKGYSENLRSVRNTDLKPAVQKLFDVTLKLIPEEKLVISEVSDWWNSTW